MSTDVSVEPMGPVVKVRRKPRREVIYRHTLPVRLSHWVNALVVFLMIGSGLNIFNAHPRLYWGRAGDEADPALVSIGARLGPKGGLHGVTHIERRASKPPACWAPR